MVEIGVDDVVDILLGSLVEVAEKIPLPVIDEPRFESVSEVAVSEIALNEITLEDSVDEGTKVVPGSETALEIIGPEDGKDPEDTVGRDVTLDSGLE